MIGCLSNEKLHSQPPFMELQLESGSVIAESASRKLDPNHALRQNTVDLNCLYLHAIRSRSCSNQLRSKKTAKIQNRNKNLLKKTAQITNYNKNTVVMIIYTFAMISYSLINIMIYTLILSSYTYLYVSIRIYTYL